jgi:hypothetical protein
MWAASALAAQPARTALGKGGFGTWDQWRPEWANGQLIPIPGAGTGCFHLRAEHLGLIGNAFRQSRLATVTRNGVQPNALRQMPYQCGPKRELAPGHITGRSGGRGQLGGGGVMRQGPAQSRGWIVPGPGTPAG